MAKTSSSKRKSSTKTKSTPNTRVKSSVRLKGGENLRDEILTISVLVVNLILLMCNVGWVGKFGNVLKEVQVGLFGFMGYIFPVIMVYICCLLLANKGNIDSRTKSIAVISIMICTAAIIHLFTGEDFTSVESFGAYYLSQSGGGVIGASLAELFKKIIGPVVALIILSIFIVIAIIIISERSLVSFIKKIASILFNKTKEGIAKQKSKRRQVREPEDYYENADDYTEADYDKSNSGRIISIMDLGTTPLADTDDVLLATENTAQDDYETEAVVPVLEGDEIYTSGIRESDRVSNRRRPGRARPEDMPGIMPNKQSRADIFTGKITKADDISEIIEPRPEELEEDVLNRLNDILYNDSEISGRTLSIEEEGEADNLEENSNIEDMVPDGMDDGLESEYREDIEAEASEDIDVLESTDTSEFIHSASGKIIEKDTEALNKKAINKHKADSNISNSMSFTDNSAGITSTGPEKPRKEYVYPPTSLLKTPSKSQTSLSDDEFKSTAIKLQQTLHNFGIEVNVSNISCGPTVTRYEILPKPGVKVSRIVNLIDDIKLSLAASDIRIEAPIPGKSAVGIEVPNKENTIVSLRELFESEEFKNNKALINFVLGKDIAGKPIVSDIATMPHMLIAGATGSGKSVCINTLIMSILYKYSPDEVRLIMVDPKVVELSVYNGIPHLLIPVVTDPKKASAALNWAVKEMTERYNKFAQTGMKNLSAYNEKMSALDPDFKKLPKIVIIIDELADLMMVAQNEVEDAICRLAQLARACGIHLIIATQRPSVNVITGLIKANIPSRIAFAVSSGIDSRTILDQVGAEKLLGKGDMLFAPQSLPKPIRVQGAFVSDTEVQSVVGFLCNQGLEFGFDESAISNMQENSQESMQQTASADIDELFTQVGRFIIERDKASIGNLQRVFKIGFNRAARIMDQLYEAGVVGEEQGTKPRQVLMTLEEFNEYVR